MNRKMVFYTTGHILILEAVLFVLPLLCSVIYRETSSVIAFAISAGIALGIGLVMSALSHTNNKLIFAKEGFAIVALAWFAVSAVGALPFVIGKFIPSYVDALFETVSGFTTTGATILSGAEIEAMSHGMLFWRSFTHWIGGMGVLVFLMAILPTDSGRAIHIMRAEVPGPIVGKIVPKIRETAKILYLIYIGMTVIMVGFLLAGKMPLFDSLVHTFGTAGTGGFGIKSDSIASYSPYLQWVITVFMLLFGINFNLYFLILVGKFTSALKSSELWCFLGIAAVSIGAIALNVSHLFSSVGETIRHSAFQVSSIISTTGFTTVDINAWPGFSKTLLLILMFIGSCAGSTAGGLKVSRVMLLVKSVKADLKKMLRPRSVNVVKLEGKPVDDGTIHSATIYLTTYFIIFLTLILFVSIDGFNIETTLSSVTSCLNNIGPAYGDAASNYAGFSGMSKILLSLAMLIGRLEIFPILLALSPATWRKK
ncbi:MAG: TrkH family potassium uptake protein [Clostridia bacterium]|nr:TrkH family potassium uptake protein [Clostridia bacterium]